MSKFKTKRIYERPNNSDGIRVLVDRIWPRGISKEEAQLTRWMKEIAPSTQLRQWFGHEPEKFAEFKRRYEAELRDEGARDYLELLQSWAVDHSVTLVYAAKDVQFNQAVVLQQFLLDNS